jgi:hypothetical protein
MRARFRRNRFLTRGLGAVLTVLVCGGALDWGHIGGDDRDCSIVVTRHDHAKHRFSAAANSTPDDHCYLCHSLRLLHVSLAAQNGRLTLDVQATGYAVTDRVSGGDTFLSSFSSRAPPSARA